MSVVDLKNYTAQFYHLYVENPIFCEFFSFSTSQMRGRDEEGANFDIMEKPRSTFPI